MQSHTRDVKPRPYHHGSLRRALIDAGIEVLTETGPGGLTLRGVAQRAGVSHAAPYAHFADKQALLAAVSAEGYRMLYDRLVAATAGREGDPRAQLLEAACAYLGFAREHPAHFRITLSGLVERQADHPEYLSIAHRCFDLVRGVVRACQRAGALGAGEEDQVAVAVWALVHGLASLSLEGQIPHTVAEALPDRELVRAALGRMTGA